MTARSRTLWRGYRWRESSWTRVRAVMALGMVLGLGSVGTMAKWSQTVTAETGLFATGSIDLRINGVVPEYTFAPIVNLMPGATASGMINLQNEGEINLAYLMNMKVKPNTTVDATPGFQRGNAASLGDNLRLDVYAGGTSNDITCSGGTQQLVTQRPMTASDTNVALLNSARSINGGTTDSLCFKVTLLPSAPRDSRTAQVGVTFTVNADAA